MSKTRLLTCLAMLALLLMPVMEVVSAPTRGAGRAIVAGKTGGAFVRFPEKTAHQYPNGRLEVNEGDAFTDGHRIETESDGKLCIVLTPGAVMCVNADSSVRLNALREMPEGLPRRAGRCAHD